ncbi:MAG: D-alanyl-D-alanine carboxypeptidase [Ruminococcaceae bacterium]|nr:D-alanyl-D-alanine carboxypeptidase [Oscillospiraceae bacterium]
MRKLTTILSLILAITLIAPSAVSAIDGVSAQSAILIEAGSGDVIYEKNSHAILPMASTTKIMTALVALENSDIAKKVKISPAACGVEGSSIYLKEGEELFLEDLLYALMLESANDAAAAIAYEISGSIDAFADLMNETAAKIGLSDTHFTNPHGLDNEAHYTTAADLAKLTSYALQNPLFRKIVSTKKKEIPMNNGDGTRVLVNHNKLLRLSDDVIGVKTGFTKRSGRCLVSAAERDGVCVIAVTLNAPDDWNDHLAMHEEGFASYSSITLADIGEIEVQIPCACADGGYITATNKESLTVCVKNGVKIECIIEAYRLIIPPIIENAVIGQAVYYADGKRIGEVLLYSLDTVNTPQDTRSLGEKILDKFGLRN